jgi:hypothetical protein
MRASGSKRQEFPETLLSLRDAPQLLERHPRVVHHARILRPQFAQHLQIGKRYGVLSRFGIDAAQQVEGSLRLGVQVVRLLPIFLLARFGFAKLQFSAAPLLFPGVRR